MIHGESQEFFNAADYFVDRNIRQGRGHKVAVYTEYRNYTYNDIQKMTNKIVRFYPPTQKTTGSARGAPSCGLRF